MLHTVEYVIFPLNTENLVYFKSKISFQERIP